MNELSLALFYEGDTDERFLSSVITRTATQILERNNRYNIEVTLWLKIKDGKTDRDKEILRAALRAAGYDALIIHADAEIKSPPTDNSPTI